MSGSVPFFIVGSARSGTTLLRLMLNAHPEIAVPPESRFITEFYDPNQPDVDADAFLARLEAHRRFQLWDLPIEAVRRELGEGRVSFKEAIEAPYLAWMHVNGKSRWGDKTPRYIEKIPELNTLWPDARFVHLVRDGRNVALSYADVPFGPKTVAKAADLWARRVRAGMASSELLGDRYIKVRYEDLVDDTEEQIKKLCDFLGINFDPTMLDATERARAVISTRSGQYNPHITEDPIKGAREWQHQMPTDHVEIFEAIAGDVLSELGYERRYPQPSAGARIKAALGKAGLPIGRLRSQGVEQSPGLGPSAR